MLLLDVKYYEGKLSIEALFFKAVLADEKVVTLGSSQSL